MDALKHLLGRSETGDRGAMFAAAVLAQANEVLTGDYELGLDLARAVRYREGEVVIETFHGAVAAKLQADREVLHKKIQARLARVFPHQPLPVTRVSIRAH